MNNLPVERVTQSDEAMLVDSANVSYVDPEEARERLKKAHTGFRDLRVRTSDLKFDFDDNSPVLKRGEDAYVLKHAALSRLERVFGMSPSYFSAVDSDFLFQHLNYHLAKGDQEVILKLDGTSDIRGVLRSDENNISSLDLFNVFLESPQIFPNYALSYFRYVNDAMHLRLVDKNVSFSLPSTREPFHLGMYSYNEECNPVKFDFGFMLWQMWCSNGAIRTFVETPAFAHGFSSFSCAELKNKIAPAIAGIAQMTALFPSNVKELEQTTWTSEEWTMFLKQLQKGKGGKGFAMKVAKHYEDKQHPANGLSLYSTITNVSQKMSLGARRKFDTMAMNMVFGGVKGLL